MRTSNAIIFVLCLLFGANTLLASDYIRIKNRWIKDGKTEYKINIQEATVDAGAVLPNWWSADWTLEKVDNSDFYRIKNRWVKDGKTTYCLHNQNGKIEAGAIQPNWWSAQWKLIPVGDNKHYRIQNRWYPDRYLHIQNAALEVGTIQPNWWSAQWELEGFRTSSGASTTTATTATPASIDGLKILTHNAYLINPPLGIAAAPDRSGRARKIAAASYIRGNDIVILNELFDNTASDIIMNGLKREYPHQTKVAGRSKEGWDKTLGDYRAGDRLEAGVAVLSKWPIEKKIQYLFTKNDLCGWDAHANKGFVYVQIKYKNSQNLHIIATHAQAADGGCDNKRSGYEHGAEQRTREFQAIRRFLLNQQISKNDYVFIGGDLNVIKGTPEYTDMLSSLNADDIASTGHYATYDPARNSLIGDKSLRSELLDYILVSKDFKQPTQWFNHVAIPSGNYADHYPVVGTVRALGNPISPPKYYEISFKTGSIHGGAFGTESAGTDAKIHITLIGSKGVSQEVYVNDKIAGNAFEANSRSLLTIETKDIGTLQKIRIRKANGDDWYLTGVDVKNEVTNKVARWTGKVDMEGGTKDFTLR